MVEQSFIDPAEGRKALDSFVIGAVEKIWPWTEKSLAILVCFLAAADYASTVGFLKLGVDKGAYEAGVLARVAFNKYGLIGLLINDVIAVCLLLLCAVAARYLCVKNRETRRFSHIAFVLTLLPYVAAAAAAVVNNLFIILS